MIDSFVKAIGQLTDPRILRVLGGSVLLSIACFVLSWIGIAWLLTSVQLVEIEWLDTALDVLGGVTTLVLTWLLFPLLTVAFIGLFLEHIASAVEAKHYPHLPKAPGITLWQGLGASLRFLGLVLVVNVLLLLLLLFPPAYPIGYLVGNGYLIGREYFDLVALRRLPPADAHALRSRCSGEMLLLGAATALLLTIPFVNLVAPVIATAAMVHRFETWRARYSVGG